MKWFVLVRGFIAVGILMLCVSCSGSPQEGGARTLDQAGERFVKLGLQLGHYDKDYVDAYLGPSEWVEQAEAGLLSKEDLVDEISVLYAQLQGYSPANHDQEIRYSSLLKNVRAMDIRARMAIGETFLFEDEARLIYDVTLPNYDFNEFDNTLNDIAKLIPGEGELSDRVDSFMDTLKIPDQQREAVVSRAIEECQSRTKEYIELPDSERFTLEYVTGKSWGGYNWYQGDDESLMQINLDFPMRISSAISLGCHEGYPGHHVWNVLIENELLNEKGWIEYSIFPLFSPFGLIAEGSANYGIKMAFPGNEKEDYERDILFPMAGLDPGGIETLTQLNKLRGKLSYAQLATAQLYLDGLISRTEAIELCRKYGLTSRARAEQSVAFIEQYRAYVLNYSLGQDIIKNYIEQKGDAPDIRWNAFEYIITSLSTASDLVFPPF